MLTLPTPSIAMHWTVKTIWLNLYESLESDRPVGEGGEGVIWEVGSVSGGVGTLSISIDLSHASPLTSIISRFAQK